MYILLLLSSLVFADDSVDVRSLLEKSYNRDNTFCKIGENKIQIQVRGDLLQTDAKEKMYGEYVLYYKKIKPEMLKFNQDKLNSYRLFEGKGTLCTKSLAYPLAGDKVAVLFLKENRPSLDKLTIQIFDNKTLEASQTIESDYVTDMAELYPGGFIFHTYIERHDSGIMGKMKMNGADFIFQDREFAYWMAYTSKGFKNVGAVTYEKFHWKNYFKDKKDFFDYSGWNETEEKFTNTTLYVAASHKTKKECILLVPEKITLTGSEAWRCN